MAAVYLHGGGGDPTSFRPFLDTARGGKIAFVFLADAEDDLPEYRALFGLDAATTPLISVSPERPLTLAALQAIQPSGVFVGGGLTPRYRQALCADTAWLDYLRARNIPYCGTSAGAAIAAAQAIVGGWRVRRGGQVTQMLYQGAGEDLDLLEVRPGLGLVPFSIDVHASQWGTLSRLLHAVDTGQTGEGWAIDENTLLTIHTGSVSVSGSGQVYHVRKGKPLEAAIYTDGAVIPSRS